MPIEGDVGTNNPTGVEGSISSIRLLPGHQLFDSFRDKVLELENLNQLILLLFFLPLLHHTLIYGLILQVFSLNVYSSLELFLGINDYIEELLKRLLILLDCCIFHSFLKPKLNSFDYLSFIVRISSSGLLTDDNTSLCPLEYDILIVVGLLFDALLQRVDLELLICLRYSH